MNQIADNQIKSRSHLVYGLSPKIESIYVTRRESQNRFGSTDKNAIRVGQIAGKFVRMRARIIRSQYKIKL